MYYNFIFTPHLNRHKKMNKDISPFIKKRRHRYGSRNFGMMRWMVLSSYPLKKKKTVIPTLGKNGTHEQSGWGPLLNVHSGTAKSFRTITFCSADLRVLFPFSTTHSKQTCCVVVGPPRVKHGLFVPLGACFQKG